MFKSVSLLLCLLFLVFVSADSLEIQSSLSTDLSKSFTATCDGSNVCMYSVVLSSVNITTEYEAQVTVTVGSVVQPDVQVSVNYTNPAVINFEVTDKTPISVMLELKPMSIYGALFQVFNKPDGLGDLVLDSQSTQFLLANTCVGTGCTLIFVRSASGWPNTLAALFYINGVSVATLNSTNPTDVDITFNEGQILTIELVGITTGLPNDLEVVVFFGGSQIFGWSSNAYFIPLVFPGVCAPPPIPIPSPFGGPLIPVTQGEIDAFLASVGTSLSTLWYRQTVNQE